MSRDRDAFEKWCVEKKVDVSKLNGTDEYVWGNTCMRWAAWQASLAYRDAELRAIIKKWNAVDGSHFGLENAEYFFGRCADELEELLTKEKE